MPWLTVKEAAEKMGCSLNTIRRKKDTGEFETKYEHNPKGQPILKLFISDTHNSVILSDTQNEKSVILSDTQNLEYQDKNNTEKSSDTQNLAHPDVPKCVPNDNLVILTQDNLLKNNKIISDTHNSVILSDTQNEISVIPSDTQNENLVMDNFSDTQNEISVIPSDTQISQLDNYDENWIPIDEAVKLSGISRRTIYRQINNNELLANVITDDVSKTKTLVKVSGFAKEVQLRWKEIVASKNNALMTIDKDKKEFELKAADVKEKAWSRFTIVKALREAKEQAKMNNIPLISAYNDFVDKLNHYEVCEQEMRKIGSSVSLKSILRWDKTLRDNNDPTFPLCLCENKKGAVGRKAAADRLLVNQIRKMAWDFRNLRATDIYRLMERDLVSCGAEMPVSLRTLSTIVEKARKDELAMAVNRGKKAYKDQIRPHVHRINNAEPGDIYESDGHKLNNLVMSPFYAHQPSFRFLVRPILVVWYDVATGCITGYCLSLAETPNAVRTSLRMALIEFGIPKMLRMDNGTSYKNAIHCPHEFAGRKGNTPAKTKALDMISNGDLGLYKNLGLNYSFTIPGNSESKMIEPFWGFCLQQFEKAFPVWIGNKIQERHEELRLTNKALIKKYGDDIPTWEEYSKMLDEYIRYWNNSKRPVLRNALGDQMSPYEAFSQANLDTLSEVDADRLIRDPYPQIATVDRGEILVNGIFYSHDMFMALNGRKVKYYYNELNIHELTVASEHGEILYEKAQMVMPGLQVGDDLRALVEVRHREKQGKLAYLAMNDVDSMAGKQKALEDMSGDTLINQSRLQELRKDNKIKKLEGSTRRKSKSDDDDRMSKFWELTDEENAKLLEKQKEDIAREEAEKARKQQEEDAIWEAQMEQIRRERQQEEEDKPEFTDEEVHEAFKKLGMI